MVLSVALGLFALLEPCSIGAALLVAKSLEKSSPLARFVQLSVFGLTRAIVLGVVGLLAVLAGSALTGFQRTVWLVLGILYASFGLVYLARRGAIPSLPIGPRLSSVLARRESLALGVVFGLYLPACAAPLVAALVAAGVNYGAGAGRLTQGFLAFAVFGLMLATPLFVLTAFKSSRDALDHFTGLSRRLPALTGAMFVALGAWSIWLAYALPT